MPTETDVKLAEDLAEFRLESEKRFGSIDKDLSDIRSDLAWIKRIGAFIVAFMVAAVATSGRVIWDASALNTEVKQQGRLVEEVRSEVKQQGALAWTRSTGSLTPSSAVPHQSPGGDHGWICQLVDQSTPWGDGRG